MTDNMKLAEEQVGRSLWMLEQLSKRNVLLNVAAAISRGRKNVEAENAILREMLQVVLDSGVLPPEMGERVRAALRAR